MSFIKNLRHWLTGKKKTPGLTHSSISPAITRDLGVRVERIRLPSGGEVVIVERIVDDAVSVVELRPAESEAVVGAVTEVVTDAAAEIAPRRPTV
jgi:hypothetical protein